MIFLKVLYFLQVRTDWFAYAVLHTLPWIGSELNEKKHEELNNLLEGLQKYIEQRKKDHVPVCHILAKYKLTDTSRMV